MPVVAAESIRTFNENDQSTSFIATVHLSPAAEVPNAINIQDSSCSDIPSMAVAEQVPVSNRDADLDFLSLRCADRYSLARGEFVSAHFHKASRFSWLGIKLGKRENIGVIVKIDCNGLVANSPLEVGDKILSINQRPCSKMTSVEICDLLNSLTDITLIAHNPSGGAADVIESMLTKERPNDIIGVGFRHDHTYNKFIVSQIVGRAISNSLLNVGDEIISINGIATEKLSDAEAKDLIRSAPKTVTFKAITLQETGVVLGEIQTKEVASAIPRQQQSAGTPPPQSSGTTATTRTRANNNGGRFDIFECLFQAFSVPAAPGWR